jgi:hypothetical protein
VVYWTGVLQVEKGWVKSPVLADRKWVGWMMVSVEEWNAQQGYCKEYRWGQFQWLETSSEAARILETLVSYHIITNSMRQCPS